MSQDLENAKRTLALERAHKRLAVTAVIYLLLTLGFCNWLLFDTWVNKHTLFVSLGYDITSLKLAPFHLIAYTVIGGAIGGIVNGIRSVLIHYKGFDSSYFWKYISAPWTGAALAMIGFAILRSTVEIFGGSVTPAGTTTQFLANFGIGALAGYGSRDLFIWLDNQVSKLFAVHETTPNVTGQLERVAVSQIQKQGLPVGAIATAVAGTPKEAGKVVDQAPAPGMPIERGQPVDIVVAKSPNGEEPAAQPS